MNSHKLIKLLTMCFAATALFSGCTKLDQNLNSTLTKDQATNALGANGTQLLLQSAYNDVGAPYGKPGELLTLQEVPGDEIVVPTRAGDWDDNGAWRSLKTQTFGVNGVSQINTEFNNLNKINFDATNVLAFNPSKAQAAEARFLRALSLYDLMDLFNQYAVRQPGENLLNPPKVYSGDSAVNFVISELTAIIPDLPPANGMDKANIDAANMLLMKMYLNKGAFLNRAAPTFDAADMQKVITLGNAIINSGKYSYSKNYFDNFTATNHNSTEGIFAYPNFSGVATNNNGVQERWWGTLHYNSYKPLAPQGGWNGFSTTADFYNSFGVNGTKATLTPADTILDQRIGGRFYKGLTDLSGLRSGLLLGQQYYADGSKVQDRKGNLLIFNTNFSQDLKETGPLLEDVGIRILKYIPDLSDGGKNYGGVTSGNWVMIFRYPEVVLMVAEAKMRAAAPDNAGALALVNGLRSARSAPALVSMSLVNTNDINDPNTLLAERGRELYYEIARRTDLIRFGMFMKPWYLKPASDATHLLFPIPATALAANPNLKQNPGY